jgi:hypothetical protein
LVSRSAIGQMVYICPIAFGMHLFNRPFPHHSSPMGWFKTGILFCLFVVGFIFIFKPFDLHLVAERRLIEISCLFGWITFCGYFFSNLLLHFFFPTFFQEEQWTTGKQLLFVAFILLLIGFLNQFAFYVLYDIGFTWKSILLFELRTIAVGLLPVTGYILYVQNKWLRQFKGAASKLQAQLDQKKILDTANTPPIIEPSNHEEWIVFDSDNKGEFFKVKVDQVVLIEAASNYIKIYYELNQQCQYVLLRMTLKKAVEMLQPYSFFFRCHRAYIVNFLKIQSIEGNAQGYKLQLYGMEALIPVSKNLNQKFNDQIIAFSSESSPKY